MPRRAFVKRMRKEKFYKQHAGYVTLLSVLIVGSIGAALAVSLILLGLGSSRTSFALHESTLAKALSDACAEEALEKIRDVPSFSGNGVLNFGQGICNFTVQSTGGENRTVSVSSTVGSVVRKVKITLDKITPQINIVSWQEIADF